MGIYMCVCGVGGWGESERAREKERERESDRASERARERDVIINTQTHT
jgi:hypothetical protein